MAELNVVTSSGTTPPLRSLKSSYFDFALAASHACSTKSISARIVVSDIIMRYS